MRRGRRLRRCPVPARAGPAGARLELPRRRFRVDHAAVRRRSGARDDERDAERPSSSPSRRCASRSARRRPARMRFRPSAWRMSAAHPFRTRSRASSSRRSGRASPTATGSRSSAGSRRPSPPGGYGSRGPWGSPSRATRRCASSTPTREASARCSSAGRRSSVSTWTDSDSPSPATDAEGWLATGDLGYLDEDGDLFLVDRKKEMILRGAYNVYPREVEDALYAHPRSWRLRWSACPRVARRRGGGVRRAAVRARPSRRGASGVDEGARRGVQVPAPVVLLDELPKGPTGKILKRSIDLTLVTGGGQRRPAVEGQAAPALPDQGR